MLGRRSGHVTAIVAAVKSSNDHANTANSQAFVTSQNVSRDSQLNVGRAMQFPHHSGWRTAIDRCY
jgi:hypothetical protein